MARPDESKYFATFYMQKSKHFLFPLISDTVYRNDAIKSYLFCNELEESIKENFLILQVQKNLDIKDDLLNQYIVSVYEKDKFDLYIIDLCHWEEDIKKFLEGKYSQLSAAAKNRILKYFKYNKISIKDKSLKFKTPEEIAASVNGTYYFQVFLYPEEFKSYVIEEMVDVYELFDTYQEAERVFEEIGGFCPVYDEEKETLILNKTNENIDKCIDAPEPVGGVEEV